MLVAAGESEDWEAHDHATLSRFAGIRPEKFRKIDPAAALGPWLEFLRITKGGKLLLTILPQKRVKRCVAHGTLDYIY